MADLRKLMADVLANGRVEGKEIELLRQHLYADGGIDREEANFLVELHKRIQKKTPGFEAFLYQALKDHILADGAISAEETAWLRQMIFFDGQVRDKERKFLNQLKGEAREVCPEFEALHAECQL